jgi:hypothetical protein
MIEGREGAAEVACLGSLAVVERCLVELYLSQSYVRGLSLQMASGREVVSCHRGQLQVPLTSRHRW